MFALCFCAFWLLELVLGQLVALGAIFQIFSQLMRLFSSSVPVSV